MINRIRNRQKGFTLIELLIVVAIIGIIAALLIPNFLDALQKAKQKRTVADIRNIGTAAFSWLTDQVGAAAAGTAATQVSTGDYTASTQTIYQGLLVPQYVQSVPAKDGWKTNYSYFLETSQVLKRTVMAIGSGGRNGNTVSGTYDVGGFDPTDYDQDIVWADGFFARWPQKQ